ncbi:hypothetical protein [Corynebacterium freiburgense]|uniref:hypothetical protein n=1 Tax=Corynebacterium freiburgense TaxID=556548 RepID=UPI00041518AC|nr:hypothetical protein [Corynebacterium freiburgense]WJZ01327.1 hypothetical protein CFREI_00035 [Corynebacterium freiburgense]
MRHLSPEQLLLIADQCCKQYRVDVIDFSAIFAAASITGGQFEGVPVHRHSSSARESLESAIVALTPLSAHNEEFAKIAGQVFARINT